MHSKNNLDINLRKRISHNDSNLEQSYKFMKIISCYTIVFPTRRVGMYIERSVQKEGTTPAGVECSQCTMFSINM